MNFLLTEACRVPLTVCACGRQAGAVRHLVTAPLTPIKMGPITVSYRTFHLVWAVNYPRSSVLPPSALQASGFTSCMLPNTHPPRAQCEFV